MYDPSRLRVPPVPARPPGPRSRPCDRPAIRDAFRRNLTITANGRQSSAKPLSIPQQENPDPARYRRFRPGGRRILPSRPGSSQDHQTESVSPEIYQRNITAVTISYDRLTGHRERGLLAAARGPAPRAGTLRKCPILEHSGRLIPHDGRGLKRTGNCLARRHNHLRKWPRHYWRRKPDSRARGTGGARGSQGWSWRGTQSLLSLLPGSVQITRRIWPVRSSWYPLGARILRVNRKLRDNRGKPPLEPPPGLRLILLMPGQLMVLDRHSEARTSRRPVHHPLRTAGRAGRAGRGAGDRVHG
jgi:hypothetical protein